MLGEVIHGYRIDRALSSDKGGFGDVFFATHVDSGAEAVVKVLKPAMSAQNDIVVRFFNEARAAASVHHPGIVQIHNVGYHGSRAYLLMERLRGDDLETRLARGPLPVDRAVVFLRQAAGAIGAAHEQGIVHRDLKPANLFVVADPDVVGGERVKVLDFGIAKLTEVGPGKTQGVFGTPTYMSPEQCANTGAVDGRSDLYSLGCILYELVCGRPPFGHGGLEIIAAHMRDAPLPPRSIAPWLPPAIEQVILRLLEKHPDRRYPSCAALIAALDEAAHASGLAAVSASQLPSAGAPSAGTGYPPTGYAPIAGAPMAGTPVPSTFSSAAGAVSTQRIGKRGAGKWIGSGAVAVVGAAVAAIMVVGGRPTGSGTPAGSGAPVGSAAASVAAVAPSHAGTLAAAPSDAGVVAIAQSATAAVAPRGAASQAPGPSAAATAVPRGTASQAPAASAAAAPRGQSSAPSAVAVAPRGAANEAAVPTGGAAAVAPRGPASQAPVPAGANLSDADLADALKAIGEAIMNEKSPNFEKARLLYRESLALALSPRAFIGWGFAAQALGLLDEADVAFRGALAVARNERAAQGAREHILNVADAAKKNGVTLHSLPVPSPTLSLPGSLEDRSYALNEVGKEALVNHRYDTARALFQRAYALFPSVKPLANLATAQVQLGHCDDARAIARQVIATWPEDLAELRAQRVRAQKLIDVCNAR